MHRGARQQRRIDLEGRVFGGGPDEGEQARLDMRQDASCCALLNRCTSSTNTTVRTLACCAPLGAFYASRMSLTPPSTADIAMNCASNPWCDQPRQRRLTHPRRAPQDHRMQPPGLERHAQRLARAEQMLLADDLVERARAAVAPPAARPARRRTAAGVRRRSLFDHVRTGRRRVVKRVRRKRDAGRELAELQRRALVEGIDDLHRHQLLARNPMRTDLNAPSACLGCASTHSNRPWAAAPTA